MIQLSDTEIFDLAVTVPERMGRFTKHQLEQLASTESLQHWRCKDTIGTTHSFDVLSLPGRLILAGDTGELILKRLHGWGHEWVRLCLLEEIAYIAEKVTMVPTDLLSPAAILPWMRLQLAALKTFRRLLLQQPAAASAPQVAP